MSESTDISARSTLLRGGVKSTPTSSARPGRWSLTAIALAASLLVPGVIAAKASVSAQSLTTVSGADVMAPAADEELMALAGASMSERVAGADRYTMSVEVARQVGGGSLNGLDRLIVVTGEKFPDGLTASGLAGYLDEGGRSGRTAILLTRIDSLPTVVADAIGESGVPAERVIVVGGTAVVSDAVRAAIGSAAGWNGQGANPVIRIAGQDRYETAAEIAKYVSENAAGGLADSYRTVLVASGVDFPDALAGGALAYRNGHLILLSRPPAAPPAALEAIDVVRATCAVLLGGPAALAAPVGTQVQSQLTAGGCGVERIGGADRYETAALIANRFVTRNGVATQTVLASGAEFADVMTAAPLAGGNRPILLTNPSQLHPSTAAWLQANGSGLNRILVIGGPSAVPAEVVNNAVAAAQTPGTGGGSTTPPPPPPPPPPLPAAVPVLLSAGEYYTCGIPDADDGVVYCWGRNKDGRLGVGDAIAVNEQTSFPLPVADGVGVPGGGFVNTGVSSVSSGKEFGCLLRHSSVFCWGNNEYGQLGNPDAGNLPAPQNTQAGSVTPVKVAAGGGFTNTDVTSFSAGGAMACAVQDGSVYCWGNNDYGQLGTGAVGGTSDIPVKVVAGGGFTNTTVASVAAGEDHVCAMESGAVYCWGRNNYGQLGTGAVGGPSDTPVKVATGGGFSNTAVTAISSKRHFVCAIEGTSVYCWGRNNYGQLGDGTTGDGADTENRSTPVKVLPGAMATNTDIDAVSTGDDFTCAIKDSTVYCWGRNNYGQLGDGSATSSTAPVKVVDGDDGFLNNTVTAVGIGDTHTCTVELGEVYCWGRNNFGQLGDASTTDRSEPVLVDFDPPTLDDRFILVLDIPDDGRVDLPLGGTVDVLIDWNLGGDPIAGCPTSRTTSGSVRCDYPAEGGEYTIAISRGPGDGPWLTEFEYWDRGDQFLIEIASFGDLGLVSLEFAFGDNGAERLEKVPSVLPSTITNVSYMFFGAEALNDPNISRWDVSNVVNMAGMFEDAGAFNQDLSDWDVSNVVNMQQMFVNASAFNNGCDPGVRTCPLTWTTSSLTDISNMFRSATVFNQYIGGWDTSAVTRMWQTFDAATAFNNGCAAGVTDADCALGWDTGAVTSMLNMFNGASVFNQDIGGWNTSAVTNMAGMFNAATVFDQNLTGWCVTNIPSAPNQFAPSLNVAKHPDWGTCP